MNLKIKCVYNDANQTKEFYFYHENKYLLHISFYHEVHYEIILKTYINKKFIEKKYTVVDIYNEYKVDGSATIYKYIVALIRNFLEINYYKLFLDDIKQRYLFEKTLSLLMVNELMNDDTKDNHSMNKIIEDYFYLEPKEALEYNENIYLYYTEDKYLFKIKTIELEEELGEIVFYSYFKDYLLNLDFNLNDEIIKKESIYFLKKMVENYSKNITFYSILFNFLNEQENSTKVLETYILKSI